MLDNFLRALYTDSVIDYNGHGYHMKDDLTVTSSSCCRTVMKCSPQISPPTITPMQTVWNPAKLIFFGC